MSDDFAGGADAPAETNTVANEPIVTPPAPVSSEPPKAETKPEPKVEEKKAPSTREALKAAADKVAEKAKAEEADKKAPPVQSKPADKAAEKALPDPKPAKAAETAQTTDKPAETAPKTDAKAPHAEAPARFKSDAAATAEWEKAPDAVKAAVHRSIRELESGIEKHRVAAEAFEQVKDFDELAKKNNTSLRDAMTRYTNLERTLLSDPIKGIQAVCDYAGISLQQLAAHVVGQKPDEVQSQNDATVRELKQEIAALKQQVGGVTNNIQQQHVAKIDAEVQRFAADHPRFDELSDQIATLLKKGMTTDLAEAYSMAERLSPAPATTVSAAPQTRTAPDPQAQTLKGSKSVSGAPSAGSDPATKRASTSIKDSLRRAVAQAG